MVKRRPNTKRFDFPLLLLLFEKHGHIARVTINRPEKRNPLGLAGDGEQFYAMAKRVNDDFDIRCVIMTGAGPAFSAGGDLKATE